MQDIEEPGSRVHTKCFERIWYFEIYWFKNCKTPLFHPIALCFGRYVTLYDAFTFSHVGHPDDGLPGDVRWRGHRTAESRRRSHDSRGCILGSGGHVDPARLRREVTTDCQPHGSRPIPDRWPGSASWTDLAARTNDAMYHLHALGPGCDGVSTTSGIAVRPPDGAHETSMYSPASAAVLSRRRETIQVLCSRP